MSSTSPDRARAHPEHASTRRGPLAWLRHLEPSALAGLMMMTATVVAVIWANSPWASSYQAVFDTTITVAIGGGGISKPAVLWINDGLMAVFFLLVGLEIKREVLEGELSSVRKAALPVVAAIGGMAVPACVYLLVNPGGLAARGWAIPAATDIAFALGIMALLGKRVPLSLKIFLTTVAVVDDIGAVLVIALFYTSQISWPMLAGAAATVALLVGLNRRRVTANTPYIVAGLVLWVLVLKSGVHATVAGVVLAMTIPACSRLEPNKFRNNVKNLFGDDEIPGRETPERVRKLLDKAEPLLLRWEHALSPGVLFFIIPLFALANAGVALGDAGLGALTGGVGLGVALGLLVGKPVGVTLAAWLAVRTGLARLPAGLTWLHVHGAAWLAGIGFTMSLFITDLAFPATETSMLAAAKIGLLTASGLAALVGVMVLVRAARRDVSSRA